MNSTHDKSLAAPGLISYRARGPFGWIMIGARNDTDAWRQARRLTGRPTDLQVWNGTQYAPIESRND